MPLLETLACIYDTNEKILDFVPLSINSWLGNKIDPIEFRPETENKVKFTEILQQNNLPNVPILFYKENGHLSILGNYLGEVLEKPIWGLQGNNITIYNEYESSLAKEGYLYQPRIVNHQEIMELTGLKTLNTVRILSYISKDGKVHLLSALIRLCNNNSITDNFAKGGIAVGIDIDSGRLKKYGKDKLGNRYKKHPQGLRNFYDFTMPYWSEVVNVVTSAANIFKKIRLLGWDVAITADGPKILEANRLSDFYLSQSQGNVFYKSIYVKENMNKIQH